MNIIQSFSDSDVGVSARVMSQDSRFIVQVVDTDVDQSVGVRSFLSLDAAVQYAQRCVQF